MITLREALDLIDENNQSAYDEAYHLWLEADDADNDGDDELAEELRTKASMAQADYFRDEYYFSSDEQKQGIKYWLKNDAEFKDQFVDFYGEFNFEKDSERGEFD